MRGCLQLSRTPQQLDKCESARPERLQPVRRTAPQTPLTVTGGSWADTDGMLQTSEIRGGESSPRSVLAGWQHWSLWPVGLPLWVAMVLASTPCLARVGKCEVLIFGFVPYSRADSTTVADKVTDPGSAYCGINTVFGLPKYFRENVTIWTLDCAYLKMCWDVIFVSQLIKAFPYAYSILDTYHETYPKESARVTEGSSCQVFTCDTKQSTTRAPLWFCNVPLASSSSLQKCSQSCLVGYLHVCLQFVQKCTKMSCPTWEGFILYRKCGTRYCSSCAQES